MSEFEEDYDDDFDLASHAPPGHLPPDLDTVPDHDYEDEDEFTLGLWYRSKPSLRLRPPINFSGRCSIIDTDRDHDFNNSGTTFGPSRSHMSGSTLHSGLNHLMVPRKSSFRSIPPDVIAALTDSELLHNPIYRNLHQDHYCLSSVLAKYAEQDLTGFGTVKSESPVPNMYQMIPHGVSSCCADSLGPNSHASSLGPSNSASQPTKFDMATNKTLEDLFESVEAPLMCPQCLPESVLWDFKDLKDQPGAPIVTKGNQKIIVQKLIKLIDSDPQSALRGNKSKSWTKTLIRKFFMDEYDQAILNLEAEQKILRLCSAHWKADTVITQDVAPMNAAKWALELSPGPKLPSASHAQKRSKDNLLVSGQKTVGVRGVSNESQRPAAHKITPTFLTHTKMDHTEPAPTNLRPLHVNPSADNLIVILTSDFPSLTDAPRLLRSMNTQSLFKQSEPSKQVTTLLNHLQFADPSLPEINKDNTCQGWGHEQFMAGGITLSVEAQN
ncbi:hypothetical protein H4582DRAFT_2205225 [Lactarius indigo]|nr:hypothetical protein H4582DRAFT_2205225 [Lactarius indigo]